jgi:hypothetical protein
MAAWRERQAVREVSAFRRLWNATGALVSSMALTVAALAALTFLGPGAVEPPAETQDIAAVSDTYSAEDVFLPPDEVSDNDMTYEQVLTTIYGAGE